MRANRHQRWWSAWTGRRCRRMNPGAILWVHVRCDSRTLEGDGKCVPKAQVEWWSCLHFWLRLQSSSALHAHMRVSNQVLGGCVHLQVASRLQQSAWEWNQLASPRHHTAIATNLPTAHSVHDNTCASIVDQSLNLVGVECVDVDSELPEYSWTQVYNLWQFCPYDWCWPGSTWLNGPSRDSLDPPPLPLQ